jgi:hypothetical protein
MSISIVGLSTEAIVQTVSIMLAYVVGFYFGQKTIKKDENGEDE